MSQIHDYSFTRTSANITDDDLIDVDATDDGGTTWFSAKMTKAELFLALASASAITNLYNDDGTLAEDRTVDLNGNTLNFIKGNLVFDTDSSNDLGLTFVNNADDTVIKIKVDSSDNPLFQVLKSGTNMFKVEDGEPVLIGDVVKSSDETVRATKINLNSAEIQEPPNTTLIPLEIKGTTTMRKYMLLGDVCFRRNGSNLQILVKGSSGLDVQHEGGIVENAQYNQNIVGATYSTIKEYIPKTAKPEQPVTGSELRLWTSYYNTTLKLGYADLRVISDDTDETITANFEIVHPDFEFTQIIWKGHYNQVFETLGGRKKNTKLVESTQTLAVTDHIVFVTVDSPITITLPLAEFTNEIIIYRTGGTATVTISPNTIGEINGNPTTVLGTAIGARKILHNDGTNWFGKS